jgi:hypothetical protein
LKGFFRIPSHAKRSQIKNLISRREERAMSADAAKKYSETFIVASSVIIAESGKPLHTANNLSKQA